MAYSAITMPLLFLLQSAFSLYLLYHAITRRAPYYWFLIILMPFGEWAYLFAVYLPARRERAFFAAPFQNFFARPSSLESLAQAQRQLPSHDNSLRYAQGLYDAGKYDQANTLFADLLAKDDDDLDAIFGYAYSCAALDESEAAISALDELTKRKLDYRNYTAVFELASLYWKCDREEECIDLLMRVCKSTQRLQPRVEVARYLHSLKRFAEARAILSSGLESLATSPAHTRRNQRVHAWQARRQLRDLPR